MLLSPPDKLQLGTEQDPSPPSKAKPVGTATDLPWLQPHGAENPLSWCPWRGAQVPPRLCSVPVMLVTRGDTTRGAVPA